MSGPARVELTNGVLFYFDEDSGCELEPLLQRDGFGWLVPVLHRIILQLSEARRVALDPLNVSDPDEALDASRAWLERLPDDHRSLASNLFSRHIRNGVGAPRVSEGGPDEQRRAVILGARAVCKAVLLGVRERIAGGRVDQLPKLCRIELELVVDPRGAVEFALERIAWELLPREERERRKAEQGARYRDAWLRGDGPPGRAS